MVDELFAKYTVNLASFSIDFDEDIMISDEYTADILSEIKELFIEGFFSYMTYGFKDGQTHLIISGYGNEEEYPVMIRQSHMLLYQSGRCTCHIRYQSRCHLSLCTKRYYGSLAYWN